MRRQGFAPPWSARKAPRATAGSTKRRARFSAESLERRVLLAAHIVGSSTVYSTIQAAVTAATAGQIITVDPGTYTEAVTVNKSLTIRGAQSGVDARSNIRQSGNNESLVSVAGAAAFGFDVAANDVTIDGFTIQGSSGLSNSNEAGVLISPNEAGTHILNNIVIDNVAGMYLANGSSTDAAVIQYNVFSLNNQTGSNTISNNGGRAIYTDGGVSGGNLTNVTIDSNFFYQNLGGTGTTGLEAAISLQAQSAPQSNIRITNNTFENGGKALLAFNASNLTITGNTVSDSQDVDSGALRFEGGVSTVTIQNNNLYYNLSPAIRIDTKAIATANSAFTITGNDIYGNGYVDEQNTPPGIIPGSVVLASSSYTGMLTMTNNWWGNSSGPSGDGPGTGDVLRTGGNSVTFSPWSTTPPVAEASPYDGLAPVPDNPINATNFDHGGSGVGFNVGAGTVDNTHNFRETAVVTQTSSDPGGTYDTPFDPTAPYDVTGFSAGQWLAFTINIPVTGTYRLDLRVANAQTTGGTFHATLDGTNVTGTMTMPDSGGLQTWQTISSGNFSASAGQHALQLLFDTNGSSGQIGSFHWLQLTTINAPPTAPTNLAATAAPGAQINLTWTNTASNQTGFEIDRSPDGTNFTLLTNVGASATSYTDSGLAPATSYYYRVEATNSSGSSASSNVASATTAAAVYVSDLNWASFTIQFFATPQKDLSVKGNPITLRGTVYPKGIGTQSISQIIYNLGGQYTSFVSDVGVDDETGGQGSVDFQVIGDGTTLYDSGPVTGTAAVVHVNVGVAGVQQLTLVANDGIPNNNSFDHADWAGAQLLRLPTVPTNLVASAASISQINLTWAAASYQTGYEIDRSPDGTNFTLLTNVAGNVTSYNDTGLSAATAYYYRVEATNSAGSSASSNVANAVTQKATPAFSALSSPTITCGASATTLSGTIAAGSLVPTGNVSITENGITQQAAINAGTGAFSSSFDTHALGVTGSPYAITFSYTGNAAFNGISDTTHTLTVNKRTLHVSATGTNRIYDGTTTDLVTLSDDRVNSDVFTDSDASANFSDKNVANGKTVSVGGISISGAAAGNYTLSATTASTTANITARTLHVTAAGVNKVYDGTTSATVTPSDDRVSGDSLIVSDTASFTDKNVGTAKTVSVTGISISGTDAGNYVLASTTAGTTANITVRTLHVTAAGVNRVYDGTTTATVNLSDDRVSGDAVTDSYTTASFANKTVANGKTISVSGISISGTDAGNYTLAATTASTTGNITVRTLTVSATGTNKVYDATTNTTVTLSDNRVSGDQLSDSYTAASFVNKNVGNAKTVNVSGISVTGTDVGNYTFNTTATATANITPFTLTLTASGVNKIYDGTTTATATFTDNRISGDQFTENYAAAFSDKNVGNGKTVSVTGISLSGTDAGNYVLASTTAGTTANITSRELTISAAGVNRVYDATTNATVTLSDNRVSGDTFIDSCLAASFSDKNVANGKTVTVSGITIVGADAGNYLFNGTASTTANITPRPLTVSAIASNKVYDATTAAAVTLSDNHLGGDQVTDNDTSALFADKNVGTAKTVMVSGISLSGTDAFNYSPNTTATTTASITVRSLTVAAAGVNKVYDGTSTATATLADNRMTGDVFTDGYSASFADKNVANAKPVSVTAITISGTDAGNYTLTNTTANTTANITPRSLTVSASGVNKVYDATTSATVNLSDNRVSGDVFTDTYTSASFADKNVGTSKTVSVSGIGVSGTDAGNYTFNTSASTTANISPLSLTVTAAGVNKVYDGGTNATVTLSDSRLAGDQLTDSYSAASFADKNVANTKTVSVSGISISGTDAGNYTANTTTTTTASITPRSLTVSAAGINKVYDGTSTAAVTLSDNRVTGDQLTDSYVSAAFVDKNVANGKSVSVSGISISGTDSGNYTLGSTTASATANITPRTLTISATGVNKIYDGTTTASVNLSDNRVSGDVFTDTYTAASYADKNVANGKPVGVSGINISGTDTPNYTFNTTAGTTANITPRTLTVTAAAANKVYDSTANATAMLSDNRVSGDVLTDGYTSALFSDKNVANGKTVTVNGINISGTDAGNYALGNTTATATANITPRPLTITATGVNKPYDGGTGATVTLSDNRLNGDSFTDSYTTASFVDKNVGNAKTINVSGITILGADAGNYVINTTAAATASITAELSIAGTGAADSITLMQDADGQHIDWFLNPGAPGTVGQLAANDPAGLTINGNGGSDTITLEPTGSGAPALPNTLHLNGTFTINGLTGTNPLANTTLEIGRSTLFISYAPGNDPLALIQSYLQNGYNPGAPGAAWTGTPSASTGVITSTPAAQNAAQTTAIGYADSADGLIAGQPANTIELKYTLYGDTTLTGSVGFNDFTRLTQHYNQTSGGTWDTGDFNYDMSVNFGDFTLMTRTYNTSLGSQVSPAASPAAAPAATAAAAPTASPTPARHDHRTGHRRRSDNCNFFSRSFKMLQLPRIVALATDFANILPWRAK